MSLPDLPPTFRQPAPAERPWCWRLLDAAGSEVAVAEEYGDQRFVSQGDAESWLGEIWHELADLGVTAVILVEHDRDVYGPMSLEA
ncbi:hypothetical protein [Nocardioides sp.]|uniref:hypothetical protein n=1 Tax=Nocardioides sp. TaxID=35761 RepID=UPI0039E2E9CF